MKQRISFVYEPSDEIKQGKTIITDDGSLVYSPAVTICPFSIYPYHWSFEITTSIISKSKYELEHFLGNQVFLNSEITNLRIPPSIAGHVYAEISFPVSDGIYYSDYSGFVQKKYYDPQKGIIAVGNIWRVGKCIEFANGQYVVVDHNHRLLSAYCELSK